MTRLTMELTLGGITQNMQMVMAGYHLYLSLKGGGAVIGIGSS
jgi:hypothetical protein